MLEADEAYFKEHQEPLFSSHMLDLSEESKEENIAICARYFQRMAPLGLWLEMEIGITGGEEDGVDEGEDAELYVDICRPDMRASVMYVGWGQCRYARRTATSLTPC